MNKDRIKTVKLLRFDVMNLNERIYTKQDFMPHLKEMLDKIAESGGIYGQIGFPNNFDISVSNASHRIIHIYTSDDFVMGDIEILDNNQGNMLLGLIESTVFRSRGAGTVDNETNEVRLASLFTFDAVAEDSDAFKGLMD